MSNQTIIIKLDGLFYGIQVSYVQEVLYSVGERALPEAPNFIQGLAYVRERLLPIIRTKRLFNSPLFDLYNHKKILVLKFGIENQIGMTIDDVVGIEIYEQEEIKQISSIYNITASQDILGFIEKKGREIILLDIVSFFFNKNGEFRYKRFVNKQQGSLQEIQKSEFANLESMVQKANFPFNQMTTKPIVKFVSRVAMLENKTIDQVLKENPNFFSKNKHMTIHQKRKTFFENPADMYMLTEYFEIFLADLTHKELKILVIGEEDSLNAVSIALILESLLKRNIKVSIVNMLESAALETEIERNFVYTEEELKKISKELYDKYFEWNQENDTYTLNANISQHIVNEKLDLESLVSQDQVFDLIYSNNYLITLNESILQHQLLLLESIMKKNGILVLGLFEDIEELVRGLKKYYIKSRLIFTKE